MRIGSSSSPIVIQINKSKNELDSSFAKLSSGLRITRAPDDAAGLAIAGGLRGDIATISKAIGNSRDAGGFLQIAESTFSQAQGIVDELAGLATQAASGTISPDQRNSLNNQYTALRDELDRLGQSTQYGGQPILNQNVSFQVGPNSSDSLNVQTPGLSAAALGLAADISTQSNAQAALDSARTATSQNGATLASFGATQQRLEFSTSNLSTRELNLSDSESRIRDVDVALEKSKQVAASIRLNFGAALPAQANRLDSQAALKLLG